LAELTHAELAAKLVAEGFLNIVQGRLPAQIPVPALPLENAEEKRLAGASPTALVVHYPVGESGVFLQMDGHQARVWYHSVDTDGAVATLEKAIIAAHPNAKFVQHAPHSVTGMGVRVYRLEVDAKRFATIEATFPIDRTLQQRFSVRVFTQERTNV
jgi:hypothetical protein